MQCTIEAAAAAYVSILSYVVNFQNRLNGSRKDRGTEWFIKCLLQSHR